MAVAAAVILQRSAMYMTFGAGRNCIRNFADTCTCSGCSSAFGSQEHATGLWSPDKYVLFDLSQIQVNASEVDSENAGLRCVYNRCGQAMVAVLATDAIGESPCLYIALVVIKSSEFTPCYGACVWSLASATVYSV